MTRRCVYVLIGMLFVAGIACAAQNVPYPIVDTGQNACFGNSRQISCPAQGERFNGQDSQYQGNQPRYRDNGDGTVSDLATGLMWVKERGIPVTWNQAMDGADDCRVGGYDDWRAPSIKELYSLIEFNGYVQMTEKDSTAFIDTHHFDFKWGDTGKGQRIIDCQDWSSTVYVGTTMGGARTAFGVNFADGRIKGYPVRDRGGRGNRYVRYVRGNTDYGKNDFIKGAGGTVKDRATGLIWQRSDDGTTRIWEEALSYCEDLELGGHSDWRLPSAKELQSIVDYTRSPTATHSAAIDPVFSVSDIESYYWTSTTHLDGPRPGGHAAYIAFGRAMGYFGPGNGQKCDMDVHGAGAQRSDPKTGTPKKGHGPQGDDQRIYNYVRCVAGGGVAYIEPANTPVPSWKGGAGRPGVRPKSSMLQPRQAPVMHQGMEREQQGIMGKGQGSQRRGPPPEAFEACESSAIGNACTVQTPHGTISGMCRDVPEGKACVPQDNSGRPRRHPVQ